VHVIIIGLHNGPDGGISQEEKFVLWMGLAHTVWLSGDACVPMVWVTSLCVPVCRRYLTSHALMTMTIQCLSVIHAFHSMITRFNRLPFSAFHFTGKFAASHVTVHAVFFSNISRFDHFVNSMYSTLRYQTAVVSDNDWYQTNYVLHTTM